MIEVEDDNLIINEQMKGPEVHRWVRSHLIGTNHQKLHEGGGCLNGALKAALPPACTALLYEKCLAGFLKHK